MLFCILPLLGKAQLSDRQIRNLEAFSKAYGYVRYFHPSDESRIEQWDDIAIIGSRRMLTIKDDDELIKELNHIYLPIAPSIKICSSAQKLKFNVSDITPPDLSDYKEISWQHLGLALYAWNEKRSYYSMKLNRSSGFEQREDLIVDLIPELYVGKSHGAFYNFNVSLSLASSFVEPVQLQLQGPGADSTLQKINGEKETRYIFSAFVPDSACSISFALKSNLEIPLSISNVTVTRDTAKHSSMLALRQLAVTDKGQYDQKFTLHIIANDRPLYHDRLKMGEHINKTIVPGINVIMPLVLYGNASSTYPAVGGAASKHNGIYAQSIASYTSSKSLEKKEVKLADVIILWNIFKHSFPYWADVKISPDKMLRTALRNSFSSISADDFLKTIEKMCSSYNDAHMFINISDLHRDNYLPPISLTKIGRDLIVKDVLATGLLDTILPGDKILSVDGFSSKKKIDASIVYFSGSKDKKESLSMVKILEGSKDSYISLGLKRGKEKLKVRLKRNLSSKYFVAGNSGYLQKANGWLKPEVYYFDLTRNTLDSNAFSKLKEAKTIIFDLRGYVFNQTINTDLIPALITDTLLANRFFVPKLSYPDYEHVTFEVDTETYTPNKTNHLTAKIIFLTDITAQSASESVLGLVKDFKLGTIIGSATSGTNGDINSAYLPGHLLVSFSGMLVKNSDGSKHHLVGVKPDFFVTQSRASITQRKDRVLEFALKSILLTPSSRR